MKIQSLNNVFNIANYNINNTNKINKFPFSNNRLSCDVISFAAKKYDADSIVDPTYHCAYCGCKVYNEVQLESIAKEMLSSKADRLQGKIKSVLEKLNEGKNSQEISLAKRMENADEIKFFKNFLEIASKKSFLKGEAIFSQVYSTDKDEAMKILLKNLHPLLRTVDHISPQNEDLANNNSDINLVEACYTCNHDLKKGSSFSEFFTMYPSIKNNMPQDKFEYAYNKLLEISQSNITRRLSASNMLKLIQSLFIQKTEAQNYLNSIDYRIKNTKGDILATIKDCETEIEEKRAEKADLENLYAQLMKDSVYRAMLRRIELETNLENQRNLLSGLRERRRRISNILNELNNPKSSKKKDELTDEEREEKINKCKAQMNATTSQISAAEEKELEISISIEELDKEFPTADTVQKEKSKIENLLDMMNRYDSVCKSIKEKEEILQDLKAKQTELENAISALSPETDQSFEPSSEETAEYERYLEITEALKFIEEHPNGGSLKILIHQSAKDKLLTEAEKLQSNPLVIQYNQDCEKAKLTKELNNINKQADDIKGQLTSLIKDKESLEAGIKDSSRKEAEEELEKVSSLLRQLNEKFNYVKIPQKIAAVNAEITLITSTIQDLQKKLDEIEKTYASET